MEREKISILDHGTEIINGIKNGAFLYTENNYSQNYF